MFSSFFKKSRPSRYKHIFVLCTGRCGSVTFIEACRHISNYSSGHETRSGLIGEERFAYPTAHIEADNRLSWLLGRLDQRYGDTAFYVHLTRDPEAVARSFAKRTGGIMAAYKGSGILMGCKETDSLVVARDYVHTVTSNIEHFLVNKTHKMGFRLENAKNDFRRFVELTQSECDLPSAQAQFEIKHNAS